MLTTPYEVRISGAGPGRAASAARAEGLQKHRFQVAQLPLNAFENGAVLGRTPGEKRETKREIREQRERNGEEEQSVA